MLTLKEAQVRLREVVTSLPAQQIATSEAAGYRLAADVQASTAWPTDDVSIMDGYAARAAEIATLGTLPIAFEIPAGHCPDTLPSGCCARIFTGALLPKGADVVVPQEDAEQTVGGVRLKPLEAGKFIRFRGEVSQAGAVLAEAGTLVTPQLLGLLVAVGPTVLGVIPRPRVAVLTTGAELLAPEAELEPGRIRDSNGPMLVALVQAAGMTCSGHQRVADSVEATVEALERACSNADLIVTNGGVSVGDYDLVPQAIERLGGELLFHRLAIRPGKPALVARLSSTWIVGLPGNPASAFVGWHLLARSLAQRLGGDPQAWQAQVVSARLEATVGNRGERTVLAPAALRYDDQTWLVRPLDWKGSHDILALARANALIEIEPGTQLEPDSQCTCRPLTPLPD